MEFINLIEKNNIYCDPKNNLLPYTGKVLGKIKGQLNNGMLDGEWIEYYDNKKIHSIINYIEN